MSQKITAEVIADSVNDNGDRITTWLVNSPRIILAEINTHRMLSRNAASSRAIPVKKRVQQVREQPFVPTFWGENKPGMQAGDKVGDNVQTHAERLWREAADHASYAAEYLSNLNIHKSIANRILEPFVYCPQLITTTDSENMFNLRVDEQAQTEYFELAGQMLRAYAASTPQVLQPDDWHIPFRDRVPSAIDIMTLLKVSSARCARLSYESHDGEFSIEKDVALADSLLQYGHMSPFEHQAQCVNIPRQITGGWLEEQNAMWNGYSVYWGNLRNWRQFRKTLKGENRDQMDVRALLAKFERVRTERGYV